MKHLLVALLFVVPLALPQMADAKAERITTYSYKKVWRTTVRHLRVVEKLKLVEKDEENGYVVFEKEDQGDIHSGSMEFITMDDPNDGTVIKLVCRLEDLPEYEEIAILDRLANKLYRDLGDPPVGKKPAPKPDKKPKKDDDKKDEVDDGTLESDENAGENVDDAPSKS